MDQVIPVQVIPLDKEMAVKPLHAGGRPLKIADPEEMRAKGEQYFSDCKAQGVPFTITGLAIALDMCSRQMLNEYEIKPEYGYIIKGFKLRVEHHLELACHRNENPAGKIFVMKNMGWSDRQDIVFTGFDGSEEFTEQEKQEIQGICSERAKRQIQRTLQGGITPALPASNDADLEG